MEENINHVDPLESEIRRLLAVRNALAPPIRPSYQDCEWFSQSMSPVDMPRVLILGITSELVDLAAGKNAARVIAMDWQAPQFSAMRPAARADWSGVESFVNDWCRFVPELEQNLDTVLGDGSLNLVVFPGEWQQIFTNLHRYLVPGGKILMRLAFQPEESLDVNSYLKEVLGCSEAECAGLQSRQRLELLRELVSEVRLAIGIASAGIEGAVDLNRRADLVRRIRSELERRCSRWKEWEEVRIGLPPEEKLLIVSSEMLREYFASRI